MKKKKIDLKKKKASVYDTRVQNETPTMCGALMVAW